MSLSNHHFAGSNLCLWSLACYCAPLRRCFSAKVAFCLVSVQPVLSRGVILSQIRDFALAFELHKVPASDFCSLPRSSSITEYSPTIVLRVHSDPSHRWLIKTLSSTDPNTDPWKIPLLAGCQLDCAPLIDSFIPAVQPAFQPHYLSLIQSLSHWLNDKVTTGHGAGVPDEIKVHSIHCLSLVHSTGDIVTESNEVGYNDLPLINLCWLFPLTLFALHMFRNYFGEYLLHNWSHRLRWDWSGTSFRPQDICFSSFGRLLFAWDKHGSLYRYHLGSGRISAWQILHIVCFISIPIDKHKHV